MKLITTYIISAFFIILLLLINNINGDELTQPIVEAAEITDTNTNTITQQQQTKTNKPSSPISFLARKQFKYNVVSKSSNLNKKNEESPSTTTKKDNEYNTINMASKDGSLYKCLIPKPVKEIKKKWVQIPSIEKIKESLLPIKSKCIKSSNPSLWWSYEFCYQDKIRQMHLEKGEVQSEFILGQYVDTPSNGQIKGIDQNILEKYKKKEIFEFPHTSSSPSSSSSISLPYFSESYEDGTQCEILNIKRQTEVRYYCSKDSTQAIIQEIGEPSSCTYLFKILTDKMCIHPLFQPKQDKALDIQCTKI